jgi:uncharacterized protein (TIGR02147 family)
MANVFNYTDYRKFLGDFYAEEKSRSRKFNYRSLATSVGFKSAGHFTQILNGRANISARLVERFVAALKLNKREAAYFRHLVQYNQARSHEEKKQHFESMISFRESSIKVVDVRQYEFYDKWYYSAVREMLDFFPCDGNNLENLGKMVQPAIHPAEVAKSLSLLEELGMIKKDLNGLYKKADPVITTEYEAQAVAINNFVISTADLAKEAIDRFPRNERNLSWMTLSVSQEGFETIQEELRAFRARALEIARQDAKANRVYQFNFQVFPMSKPYLSTFHLKA